MPEKDEEKEKGPEDKGPQPSIDLAAVRSAAADAARDAVQGAMESFHTREPEPSPEERRPQPTSRNPLADVIGPLVNPALQHLGTEVADARDAALFYVENPRFVKHKKGIEDAASALKKQGTPMTRDAVSKWYMGQHWEAFKKEDEEATTLAAEKAKDAADQGAGASRTRSVPSKDPHDMTDEELGKTLEGVAF